MKTEITKTVYDGQKFTEMGTYPSLEAAHSESQKFKFQQTFEDIDMMDRSIPYLYLVEYRDNEHHNDLYFTCHEFNN